MVMIILFMMMLSSYIRSLFNPHITSIKKMLLQFPGGKIKGHIIIFKVTQLIQVLNYKSNFKDLCFANCHIAFFGSDHQISSKKSKLFILCYRYVTLKVTFKSHLSMKILSRILSWIFKIGEERKQERKEIKKGQSKQGKSNSP